jgi:8-oxo-dGTP pyrophosphatase MutT (NUDIX family)
VVVAAGGEHVCLVHHKKLERWLQPGGHIEPGELVDAAARREAREETALAVAPHPAHPGLLDVDVHRIPARGSVPAHDHLDVRYLLVSPGSDASHDPRESLALGWFTWDQARGLASDAALVRLLGKAERRVIAARRLLPG